MNHNYFGQELDFGPREQRRVFILRDAGGAVIGVYSTEEKAHKKIVALALEGGLHGEIILDEYVVDHNL